MFYHGWLLGGVANVLKMITDHRHRIGYGDAEFGVEIEIVRSSAIGMLNPTYISLGGGTYGYGAYDFPMGRILLPVISVGGPQEFDAVINTIDTDIFDALGVRLGMPDPIVVSW